MVNAELNLVQLFIRYLHLVTTIILSKLPRAVVYSQTVRSVMIVVELCAEVSTHRIRMLSIPAVLWSDEFGLRIYLGDLGGSQISTAREDIAGGSGVLPTQRKQ